jgi:hypothetical protein
VGGDENNFFGLKPNFLTTSDENLANGTTKPNHPTHQTPFAVLRFIVEVQNVEKITRNVEFI